MPLKIRSAFRSPMTRTFINSFPDSIVQSEGAHHARDGVADNRLVRPQAFDSTAEKRKQLARNDTGNRDPFIAQPLQTRYFQCQIFRTR